MDKNLAKTKKPQVRTTQPFKLKDHPAHRNHQVVPLEKVFGFLPEVIVIEKVQGQNNRLQISAIIPEAVQKQIDAEEEKAKKELAKIAKKSAKTEKEEK